MSTPDPDAYWRRPSNGDSPPATGPAGDETPAAGTGPRHTAPEYAGPPPSTRPPAGWRTPTVAEPHVPRKLPEQDEAGIEAAEREARTFTYGVGILAGAVALILMFVVCARLIG